MKQCNSMADVREEIDRIDREIVPLLLERLQYIEAAGKIKPERSAVRDEWRINDVVSKVIQKAEELGGDQTYIEDIYRHLIDWSISHEFDIWESNNSDTISDKKNS